MIVTTSASVQVVWRLVRTILALIISPGPSDSDHSEILAATLLQSMDLRKDPCEDFYSYVCGRWDKNNPIPDGKRTVDQWSPLVIEIPLNKPILLPPRQRVFVGKTRQWHSWISWGVVPYVFKVTQTRKRQYGGDIRTGFWNGFDVVIRTIGRKITEVLRNAYCCIYLGKFQARWKREYHPV